MGTFQLLIIAMFVSMSTCRYYSPQNEKSNVQHDDLNLKPAFFSAMTDSVICNQGAGAWPSKPFEPIRIKFFLTKKFNEAFKGLTHKFLADCMTDAVDYFNKLLKVRRTTGPLSLPSSSPEVCGAGEFPDHFRNKADECVTLPTGLKDTDFVVYVHPNDKCEEGTLATASHCVSSSIDRRPTGGSVNICTQRVQAENWNKAATTSTLEHEIMHALVFSSGLFPSFYKTTDRYFEKDSVIGVTRKWKVGENNFVDVNVTLIQTPKAKQFARDHFNCPTLEGAELENEGGSGTGGSHWEKRLFGPETMTGSISRKSYLSNMTLGLFEDSGWYKVNWKEGHPLSYGKGKGCIFAQKSCREYWDSKPDTPMLAEPFCSWADYKEREVQKATRRTCSPDRAYIASCRWGTMDKDIKPKYFDDLMKKEPKYKKDNVVGGTGLTDGCATWSEAYYGAVRQGPDKGRHGDTVCENPASQPPDTWNWGVEIYGNESTCLEQDGKFEAFSCGYAGAIAPHFESSYGAGCYKYKCKKGRLLIQINYKDKYNTDENTWDPTGVLRAWKVCWSNQSTINVRRQHASDKDGKTIRYHKGTLKCPPCKQLCENNERFPNFECAPDVFISSTDPMQNPCK